MENIILSFCNYTKTLRHMPKIKRESSIILVANILSDTLTLQTQKPEKVDTSAVATVATTNGPVLSAVFEIAR
jgi:hypothetical protein